MTVGKKGDYFLIATEDFHSEAYGVTCQFGRKNSSEIKDRKKLL